jgi:hypothetical protein
MEKPERKRPGLDSKCRDENKIKIDLKEKELDGMD